MTALPVPDTLEQKYEVTPLELFFDLVFVFAIAQLSHHFLMFQPNDSTRASGASVTFEPGARTAWHTHPLGQTLIVTAGCGRVQSWGSPIEKIRPGDVIWCPPGEKHWHGATPTTAMTHISIVEQLDGKSADWMEHVSDEQYQAGSKVE